MTESPQIAPRMSSRERIMVLLLVISVVINYVDRSNLSLAVPLIQRQFALLPLQIGSLLSALFWTYALLQVSGLVGWLSDRFPGGSVLVGGYVLWSDATVVTGLVPNFSALYIATVAWSGRICGVSLLFANLCRVSARASRTNKRFDRCRYQTERVQLGYRKIGNTNGAFSPLSFESTLKGNGRALRVQLHGTGFG